MALFVPAVAILSLCFVKYELSLFFCSCATSILRGRSYLAVISDVPFMLGRVTVLSDRSGCWLDLPTYDLFTCSYSL